MAAPAAVLSILIKANTGKATTGVLRLNQSLQATESSAGKAGRALGTLAKVSAVGVGVGLGFAVKKAADFEHQLDSLGSVTRATGNQMERLRKQSMKAGADTKFSALEAAKAQTELAKGGLKVKQILDGGLNSALALAAAGEMDLAEAASTTANALNLFGLRGKNAMKVADQLATAANATTADVKDFAMALTQGGSVAKMAGLSFKETVLWLEAMAKSGIKNSDAGTSLKTSLIQLLKPTEKQEKLTKRLGLNFISAGGEMKNAADISSMLKDKLGDMTKAQRTAVLATLAGTDGVRALSALYAAGSGNLDKWKKGLGEAGTAAEVAARKQDNFKGKLENLKGSIETAAIAIGSKMLPALTDAAEQITDVLNDRKLTSAEKFTKLAEMAGKAFEDIIPIIADHAAKAAPVAAKAFVTGFLNAGVWGRLAIAGFLLAKMGGVPAFMKVGQQAGAGVGAGMATGVASSGLKGKLIGMMGSWGPALGVALAVAFGPELFKAIHQRIATPEQLAALKFKEAKEGAGSFDQLKTSVDKSTTALHDNLKVAAEHNPRMRAMQERQRQIGEEFQKTAEPVRRVQALIQNMATSSSSSVKSLREKVKLNTERIKKALGDDTKAGKDALTRNFLAAASNVRQSMHNGTISVKKGTELIEQYMVKALQGMGFTKKQALALRSRAPGSTQTPDSEGELRPTQTGGFLTGGKPTGDSIPVLAERGEYVVNRNAVRKPGVRQALDRLNYMQAPRFQQGGIVELLHPGNDPKGHGDHLHVAMSSVAAIVALGRKLQRLGWLVGEHPAFGGVGGGHAPAGYHPKGLAIDVNWPDASAERAKIAALLPMLGGPLGAIVAPEIARVLVGGPDSPLKALAQSALDNTRAGAQGLLGSVGEAEGAESGMIGGPWQGAMASIAKARGWSLAAWRRLVQKESGGDPTARNPTSGAFGLGQFLGSTAQAYAKYGALSSNPIEQINAMARYISDRYGNPTAALAFHNANNWYAAGGLVGKLGTTLRKVADVKSPKLRRAAIDKLLGRIKGVGLPGGLEKNLRVFSGDADKFGEFADRAGALSTEDANGNAIQGMVGGKTQAQWLEDQLEALFKWRNALIRAEAIVVARREAIARALEAARERKQLLVRRAKTSEKTLKELQKHPKRNQRAIKAHRLFLRAARPQIGALENRIIPGLTDRRSALNTLRGDLLSSLTDVQGLGAPAGVLRSLPALGVLGGRIFDTQMQLRDLMAPKPTVTDNESGSGSESASLLADLLREANLRTAVSEAQFKVFKNMPQFAEGGIVPGPMGAPVPAMVHGGEGVFNREQMAAMGGAQAIYVIVQDGAVDKNKIRVIAGDETRTIIRRETRIGQRGLPGRGGGS